MLSKLFWISYQLLETLLLLLLVILYVMLEEYAIFASLCDVISIQQRFYILVIMLFPPNSCNFTSSLTIYGAYLFCRNYFGFVFTAQDVNHCWFGWTAQCW